MLRARAKDHGGDVAVLVAAVHGYAAYHRGRLSDNFDPLQHFTPETVFRPSNFPKYLDAAKAAALAGEKPPFKIGKAAGRSSGTAARSDKPSDNWDLPESERQTGPVEIERYRDRKETA
jgi:hypothetical protein